MQIKTPLTVLILICLASATAAPTHADTDFTSLMRSAEAASSEGRGTQALTRYLDAARQAPSEGQARSAWLRAQELTTRHPELGATLKAHQASFEQAWKRFQAPAPVSPPVVPDPRVAQRMRFADLMQNAEAAAGAGRGPQAITRYLAAARGAPSEGEAITAWTRARELAKTHPDLAPVVKAHASEFRAAAGRFSTAAAAPVGPSALKAAIPPSTSVEKAVTQVSPTKVSGLAGASRMFPRSAAGRAGAVLAAVAVVVWAASRSSASTPANTAAETSAAPATADPVAVEPTVGGFREEEVDLVEDLPLATPD